MRAVDGRLIHAHLKVAKDYSDWVKDQIERGRFVEGRDYSPLRGNIRGRGRPRVDYFFITDAVEHIGMMSRTILSIEQVEASPLR